MKKKKHECEKMQNERQQKKKKSNKNERLLFKKKKKKNTKIENNVKDKNFVILIIYRAECPLIFVFVTP